MRIYVNKQDILDSCKRIEKCGLKNYCKICPIANALFRKFKKRYSIRAWKNIEYNNKVVFEHTNSSYKFLQEFDNAGIDRENIKPRHVYLKEVK